ncbi:hypothetical protein [Streptomyces sp. NPDC055109]
MDDGWNDGTAELYGSFAVRNTLGNSQVKSLGHVLNRYIRYPDGHTYQVGQDGVDSINKIKYYKAVNPGAVDVWRLRDTAARFGGDGTVNNAVSWYGRQDLKSNRLCSGVADVELRGNPNCGSNNNSFTLWIKSGDGKGGQISYRMLDHDDDSNPFSAPDDLVCSDYAATIGSTVTQVSDLNRAYRNHAPLTITRSTGARNGADGQCTLNMKVEVLDKM